VDAVLDTLLSLAHERGLLTHDEVDELPHRTGSGST